MGLPNKTLKIPAVLARGGTSRGLIFKRSDLPTDESLWDLIFLAALGSPDPRQLDGVGAGDSHTSKIAVVNPSLRGGADVDFLFGEVAINEARVDYAGNSGNIIAALGPFAIDEGWVQARSPSTRVRIHNLNTGKDIELEVPVRDARVDEDGDFEMPGVSGSAARIDMNFPRPAGALTGSLLSADGARSWLTLPDGGGVEASLVDAANPVVFVDGVALGVDSNRPPGQLNEDRALLARLQAIRNAASVRFKLVQRVEDAWAFSPMVPFLVLIFAPVEHPNIARAGINVKPQDMDLSVRVLSLEMIHKAVNVTVSVAITAAALVPGSLVFEASAGAARSGALRIAHPSGVTHTQVTASTTASGLAIDGVRIGRSARRIMQGEVLVQPHRLRALKKLTTSD